MRISELPVSDTHHIAILETLDIGQLITEDRSGGIGILYGYTDHSSESDIYGQIVDDKHLSEFGI
jgi:hypothetical protein